MKTFFLYLKLNKWLAVVIESHSRAKCEEEEEEEEEDEEEDMLVGPGGD